MGSSLIKQELESINLNLGQTLALCKLSKSVSLKVTVSFFQLEEMYVICKISARLHKNTITRSVKL